MTKEILDFLKKLAESRHGSLESARWSIHNEEINCRCFYCLDSKKNSRKRRFYYSLKTNVWCCHNCERKGHFAKILHDFPNIPEVDYPKLQREIGTQKIRDFIDGEHRIQDQKVVDQEWDLSYPDGARLDTLFADKVYKKLPAEDKVSLLRAVKYLQSRGVTKPWFKYFYFVFPGEKYDQYILTLFEHAGNWVWSGRKIDSNRPGVKYLHLPLFPFHTALGFANEVSTTKGRDIYVVESWFSAVLMNQAGLNAVCVFGLEHMRFDHDPLAPFQKKYNIIWCPDNDESFPLFSKINKESSRKMKIMMVPDKDAGDMATRLGDKFKEEFIKLPVRSLYNQEILNKAKTIL